MSIYNLLVKKENQSSKSNLADLLVKKETSQSKSSLADFLVKKEGFSTMQQETKLPEWQSIKPEQKTTLPEWQQIKPEVGKPPSVLEEVKDVSEISGKHATLGVFKSFATTIRAITENMFSGVATKEERKEKMKGIYGERYADALEGIGFFKATEAPANKLNEVFNQPVNKESLKIIDALSEEQQRIVKPIFDKDPKLSNWKEYLFTIESGAISLAEAVAITYITKDTNAAAVFLSSIEASDEYNQAKNAGLSPEEALKTAARTGYGTYLLEKWGLDYLFGLQGTSRFINAIKATGAETLQEEIQTLWQNINRKYSYDKAQDIFEGWWETAVGISIPSFIAGLIIPGVSLNVQNLANDIQKETGVSEEEAMAEANMLIETAKQEKESMATQAKEEEKAKVPQIGLTIEDVSGEQKEPSSKKKVSPLAGIGEDLIGDAKKAKSEGRSVDEFVEVEVPYEEILPSLVPRDGKLGKGNIWHLKKTIKTKENAQELRLTLEEQLLAEEQTVKNAGEKATTVERMNLAKTKEQLKALDLIEKELPTKSQLTDIYNKAQEVKPLEPKQAIKEATIKPKKVPVKTIIREFTSQNKDAELKKLGEKLKHQAQGARRAKADTRSKILQEIRDTKEEKRFFDSIREGILKGIAGAKNKVRKQIGFQRHIKELGSNILSRLKQKAGIREWKNATIEQLNAVLADMKQLQKGDVFISKPQVESLKEYGIKPWTTKREASKIFGNVSEWKRGGAKIVEFFKTIDQKIEHTAGKDAEKVKNILTRPRAKHVTEMIKENISLKNQMREMLDRLKINTDKDRALVMRYGEKRITLSELQDKSPNNWKQIVEADTWFREQYDKLLEETNKELSRFYPINKLIPRRKDYYTHTWELGGIWEQMKSSGDISPVLEGVSEFTKPNRKFNPFALQRGKGKGFIEDAGKAFEASLPYMLHNKHLTQDIVRHKAVADILAYSTIETKNINQFIHSLQDAANSLAGKTNPFDRALMNSVLGRQGLTILKWFPQQMAKNRIIGNMGSAIMQISGIPGSVSRNNIVRTAQGIWQQALSSTLKNDPLLKSDFLIRRYGEKGIQPGETIFPTFTQKGEKFFSIPFEAIEKQTTKSIWRASYNNAYSQGYRNDKLIEVADEITASIVGSRGLGEKALAFESGVLSLPLQFQLEVNTFAQRVNEDVLQKAFKDPKKAMRSAIETSITLFLLNLLFEKILGRKPLPDPIQTIIDMNKLDTFWEKMGRIAGEVLSSIAGGQFVASIVPDDFRKKYFGRTEVGIYPGGIPIATSIQGTFRSPERIIYDFVLPYGGGQVKKLIEGVSAISKQGSYNKNGQLQFPINQEDWVQITLFGKYSTPEAKEYFDKQRSPLSEKQTIEYFVRTQKGENPQLVYEDVASDRLRNEYKREIVKLIIHEIKANPKQGLAIMQLWVGNKIIDKEMEKDILEKLTK